MMSYDQLIRQYITCITESSSQQHLSDHHIWLRNVIRRNLTSPEWWLMGYDDHLINLLLNIGDDFLLDDNDQVALSYYSEATFLFSSTPICLIKTALCQNRMGNVREAKKNCLKAIRFCNDKNIELQPDVTIMMVDILIAADELDSALSACNKIKKSDLSGAVEEKIKEIEKTMKEKKMEREEKKKEFDNVSSKNGNKVEKEPAPLQAKKSLKQVRREQIARNKEIEKQIESAKKEQEIRNEKKEKRSMQNKKESDLHEQKNVDPTHKPIGYDVNRALEVTSSKKVLKKSRIDSKNENSKVAISQQRPPDQLSSTQVKLSLSKMQTNMDEKLSSGSVVRCICPKCCSSRVVKSKMTNCHKCQSELKLFYKKADDNNWSEPRQPPPTVVFGKYAQCKHFQRGKRCIKMPCSFAHGQDELEIWELCRAKTLQRSRSKKIETVEMKKSTSCMTIFEGETKSGHRSRTQSFSSTHSVQSAPGNFNNSINIPVSNHFSFDSKWTTEFSSGSHEEELSQSSNVPETPHDLYFESLNSCDLTNNDDNLSSAMSEENSNTVVDEEVNSNSNTADMPKEDTNNDWITVTSKEKKTVSAKKQIQMICAVCSNVISTADNAQVVRNPLLCDRCNIIGKPIQQCWDNGRFRNLRTKPSGIKHVRLCWHYKRHNDHFMSDCKFAHGHPEKILWEMEIEGKTTGEKTLAVTFPENHPQISLSSDNNVAAKALSILEKEKLRCKFCNLPPFRSQEDLLRHNSEPQHKFAVMKKLQRKPKSGLAAPKCRSPPENVYMGRYKLCRRYEKGWCHLRDKCTFAHGELEKSQWIKMFNCQSDQMIQLQEKNLFLESFSQKIRRIRDAGHNVLKENLPGVTLKYSSEARVKLNKTKEHMWIFDVRIKTTQQKLLNQVAFLLDENLDKFKLLKNPDESEETQTTQCVELNEDNFVDDLENHESAVQFCVKFYSEVFGEFNQELVLDFGDEQYLHRTLEVSVTSDEFQESLPKTVSCQILEWSLENMKLVLCPELFDPESLREQYNIPNDLFDPSKFKEFTRNTYCKLWHQILFIEEQHIQKEVARCDISNGVMEIVKNYEDAKGTVYQALPGEVFCKMDFNDRIFMDEVCGHLIARSVSSVIIRPKQNLSDSKKVYECHIKQTTPQSVVVKLNQELCQDLAPENEHVINVDLKFKFNRLPFCEMHQAIDRCGDKTAILLPVVNPRSNTQKESISTWHLAHKPNVNQHQAITLILDPNPSPPLLLIGPFGTGKTFTLNLACLAILERSKQNKVLICTHSNSAANIHLDHLHAKLQKSNSDIRPLRIVALYRKANTISHTFWKYCLLNNEKNQFQEPTWKDVDTHNVIVTTLATSRILWKFYQEGKLRFSHILIDEAAQALEPECITPLAMADDKTKVVLAGDHLQMGPSVYSKSDWVEELGPRQSLLERLFTLYKKTVSHMESNPGDGEDIKPSHVVMLTENYRCHKDILDFPSECFYGKELVARGDQSTHSWIPPLSFYTTQGRDKQREGSISYYNRAEVEEVAKRVEDLVKCSPIHWRKNIGVVTPYYDQVQMIRQALRKKRLSDVSVETVENVQGMEFRALFISTVRTAWTCLPIQNRNPDSENLDFGFLSDTRLLNTAVTRAQSLLAVVGDPMSLATVGSCREIWKEYLKRCHETGSLHGCSLKLVHDYCLHDRVLDPHAKEFTPAATSDPHNCQPTPNVASGNSCNVDDGTAFSLSCAGSTQPNSVANAKIQTKLANENQVSLKRSGVKDSQSSSLNAAQSVTQGKHVQSSCSTGSLIIQQDETKLERSMKSKIMPLTKNRNGESDNTDGLQNSISTTTDINNVAASSNDVLHVPENRDPLYDKEQKEMKDYFSIEDNDNFDDIVKVLVQACKKTKNNDELKQNQEESNEDFPPLTHGKTVAPVEKWPRQNPGRTFYSGLKNGIIELGFHIKKSNRLRRLTSGTYSSQAPDDQLLNDTEANNPDELLKLLNANPASYTKCLFRIDSSGRQQICYGQVPEPDSPDVLIPGRVRCIYEGDLVVVEMQEDKALVHGEVEVKRGFIKGILRRLISPKERQFVCTVDKSNLGVMTPINKASPKLMNFTKTDEKGIIPIYKMDDGMKVVKAVVLRGKRVKEALEGKRVFVVKFLQWRSEYPHPLGLAIRHLSYGNDFKTGMEILYEEHNIKRKFGDKALDSCKKKYPDPEKWKIPAKETWRKAYRENVFTIDPPESRDLDDAISILVVEGGCYEVGVHIADVSYFVQPNTPLDEEALSRATSYYPPKPHEVVPMLPAELSECCCSLLEGKDRLAVSVFVKLDGDANVVGEPRFERTIVRSCCKLTYQEAQQVIDEGMVDEGRVNEEESHDLKTMNSVGFQINEKETVQSNTLEIGNDLNALKIGRSCTDYNGGTEGAEISDVKSSLQENECIANIKKKIPVKVKQAILLAHKLAANLRKSRLKERSFYHPKEDGNAENHEAHEMIAEMMIMANHLVAKYLLKKFPGCTPLRVQPPPKTHRTQEWKTRFQKFTRYSLGIKSLANTDGAVEEEASEPDIKVPSATWNNIMSTLKLAAHKRSNFQELLKLICDLDQYPQLALAYSHQRKLQQRSSYTCSGEVENDIQRGHSDLELDSYCYFTSPIRRYIDVVVHRLLVHAMKNDTKPEASQENVVYTTEEITTICDRCTFLSRNCRQFDKDAKKLKLAIDLQHSISFVNAMIDELQFDRFKLFFGSGQLDLLPGKSVRIARLAPIENPIMNDDEMTVKWKFRILVLRKEDSSQPSEDESSCEDVKNTPNKDCDDEENANVMLEIPGNRWRRLLEAVKDADYENLKKSINVVDKTIQQQNNVIAKSSTTAKFVNSTVVYEHPNTGGEPSDSAETDQFLSVTKSFKSCDAVKVQLCSKVSRGILSPTIQLFQITDKMHVCLEHRNSPKQCFVKCSAQNAFQTQYDDIENYISLRKPVLMMEITTSAVQEDDTITLFNLPVKFLREEDNKSLKFLLSQTHNVEVLRLDLVCIKIKIPQNKEKQVGYWVGHFDITEAGKSEKQENKCLVKARLIQSSSPIPEFVFGGKCFVTAEIIHLNTPDRNRLGALTQCNVASDLVQNICIGMETENEIDNVLPAELSLFEMYPSLQFNRLNKYQTDAVEAALTKPFTLIQGPPGTGKTVTGVHIAYWFSRINRRPQDYSKNPAMALNYANESAVFYCGPSNKSVDVVARYLKKIPSVKILRMYSEEIERMEFPIPNKVLAFRRKHISSQLKVDEELKDVSLHHVIRSERCPLATKLQEFDKEFKECIDNRKDASRKSLVEYRKLKRDAEQWAFHDEVDIVLCTCTSAFSPRIKEVFTKNRQCIIDECGMCIESETLCAIIGSNAAQVVLIGDHKQLQPVIKDDKAKELGLGISMFERYSEKAQMLKRQYRMHEQICEFPSKYFYDGELETAKQVRDRDPDNLKLWPKGSNYPFLFHHTEGKEESLVVTTEQGNENSKKNEKEISKVVYYTRELVKSGVTRQKILVLSPYKAQCYYVKEELKKHGLADVAVMTVVASQGSEKDYVILSLVRSLSNKEIEKNPSRPWLIQNLGFVTDEHQINVALTRSKRGLCIIGNANLVRVCDVWKGLLKHYEKNDSLVHDNQD